MDDIAQLGKDRQLQGLNPLSTIIGWPTLVSMNARRLSGFLWDTWSYFLVGMMSGKLNFSEASSVFLFSAMTSACLVITFIWCIIGTFPPLVLLWKLTVGHEAKNLNLVNASDPKIFKILTQEQADVAKAKLGAEIDPSVWNPRVFDIDTAKFLLQLSALMYERNVKAVQDAVDSAFKNCHPTSDKRKNTLGGIDGPIDPGSVLTSLFDPSEAQHIIATLDNRADGGEEPIHQFAERYGICFATASELKSTSQAYCSLFWDPNGSWVLVAFKGTDPRSFEEWTTDFTATFEDCSDDIPGFRYVHKGFKDRILPAFGRKPYHSIAAAVKIVCEELVKGQDPGRKINVWFTGHSLGTAMASLAYAKALVEKDSLGPNAILRDAYVFATPIVCDIASRLFFNEKMKEGREVPRTLWRVTNRDDFVATGVPEFGDKRVEGFGEDNLFNFSHLGVELFMKDHPNPCRVTGDAVRAPDGYDVHVRSHFGSRTIDDARRQAEAKGYVQPFYVTWLQHVPIVGRLAAHATTNYWEQLERIGLLPCVREEADRR